MTSEMVRDHAASMLRSLDVTTFVFNKFCVIFETLFPPPPPTAAPEPPRALEMPTSSVCYRLLL